jgi:outer membrane receptor protein involved in Fe transport
MKELIIVVLLLIINQVAFPKNNSINLISSDVPHHVSFRGFVINKKTGKPLEMVIVRLKEFDKWCFSNNKGEFKIDNINPGLYTLQVLYLGYKPVEKKINLHSNTTGYIIKLEILSLALNEVIVIAKERSKLSSTSTIDKMAMQHIQPSGIAELFELLPGGTPQNINYSTMIPVIMRQVGSDNNTSLGTAFIIDGVPLTNDLNRQLPSGGSNDLKTRRRYSQGKGIDMREIPVDEIEKVEIIRGIPSVEYGDLTSGVVKITRKSGAMPITARIKSNAKHKLFYFGKGWNLKNGASINIGADYLNYKQDPRNNLTMYQRTTFSIRYKKYGKLSKGNYIFKYFLDYTGTLDKEKDDIEQLTLSEDSYSSSYNKISSKIEFNWFPENKTGFSISAKLSGRYSVDKLIRTRGVSLKGPTPAFTSIESGRYRVEYLPARYYAKHLTEGKPLNIFADILMKKRYHIDKLAQTIKIGINYRYGKNFGAGQIFDIHKPLYYESNSRPYCYDQIPTIKKSSCFIEIENQFKVFKNHLLKLQAGVRLETMHGIDKKYTMHKKWYADPRINISWKLPAFKNFPEITLYSGYGLHSKMPTSIHIYPNKKYYDIKEFDYYSQTPKLRSLYIFTKIIEPINYNLAPARNEKFEVGVKLRYKGFTLDVTLFDELLNNGFLSAINYFHLQYRQYDKSSIDSHAITKPPDVADLKYSIKNRFFIYRASLKTPYFIL